MTTPPDASPLDPCVRPEAVIVIEGAVINIGGSPAPVVSCLRRFRPRAALLIASPQSRPEIPGIVGRLDWHFQYAVEELADSENVVAIYLQLRRRIPAWLRERQLSPEAVLADITPGTKAMSCGLMLAGCEFLRHFNYTGGARRDKAGLGIVLDDAERPVETDNPWDALAVRETELAMELLRGDHAAAAAQVLERAAERSSLRRHELELIAAFCRLLVLADRFEFALAARGLYQIRPQIHQAPLFRSLLPEIERLLTHWSQLQRETAGNYIGPHPAVVRELLANSLRRARQSRYEDAIARLYRAAELIAQDAVAQCYGGSLGHVPKACLSMELQARFEGAGFPLMMPRQDSQGSPISNPQAKAYYQLGLKHLFDALAWSDRLEDRSIAQMYSDLAGPLLARNQSIGGHGLRPAGEVHFQALLRPLLACLHLGETDLPVWPALNLNRV